MVWWEAIPVITAWTWKRICDFVAHLCEEPSQKQYIVLMLHLESKCDLNADEEVLKQSILSFLPVRSAFSFFRRSWMFLLVRYVFARVQVCFGRELNGFETDLHIQAQLFLKRSSCRYWLWQSCVPVFIETYFWIVHLFLSETEIRSLGYGLHLDLSKEKAVDRLLRFFWTVCFRYVACFQPQINWLVSSHTGVSSPIKRWNINMKL